VGSTTYRDSIQNMNGEWKKYWLGNGGVRAPFSSVGPTFDGRLKPDVMAPGNNIVSSYSSFYLETHPDNDDIKWDVAHFDFNGRTYAWNSNSGTSMSCPAVAGAIALWLQAKPDLTPEQVMDVISHTSRHYDESMSWPNNEYGYGEIDVYRGLLYILGLDRVETISQQHTAARIAVSGGDLIITLPEPLAVSARLRLFTVGGRLQRDVRLPAGQSVYRLSLTTLPSGLYALQLDGPSVIKGSTLIRK
jgi:subtilisin family serine protease